VGTVAAKLKITWAKVDTIMLKFGMKAHVNLWVECVADHSAGVKAARRCLRFLAM